MRPAVIRADLLSPPLIIMALPHPRLERASDGGSRTRPGSAVPHTRCRRPVAGHKAELPRRTTLSNYSCWKISKIRLKIFRVEHRDSWDVRIRNPLVDNLPGVTSPFENAPPPYRRSSWPQLAHQVSLSSRT